MPDRPSRSTWNTLALAAALLAAVPATARPQEPGPGDEGLAPGLRRRPRVATPYVAASVLAGAHRVLAETGPVTEGAFGSDAALGLRVRAGPRLELGAGVLSVLTVSRQGGGLALGGEGVLRVALGDERALEAGAGAVTSVTGRHGEPPGAWLGRLGLDLGGGIAVVVEARSTSREVGGARDWAALAGLAFRGRPALLMAGLHLVTLFGGATR